MKICVITNFRTGSTSFTLLKAEEHGAPYKGEMFTPTNRPYSLGQAKATWEVHNFLMHLSTEEKDRIQSTDFFIDQLEYGHPCCFKLMNKQIWQPEKIERMLKSIDKIYYLYRRDFMAQLKSWIAVRQKGDFGGTGFKVTQERYLDHMTERQTQMHLGRLGKVETVRHHIDLTNQNNVGWGEKQGQLVAELMDGYTWMSDLYKKFPGELVAYEDYFSGEKYNPYNREITWTVDPHVIPEGYNVEDLFK